MAASRRRQSGFTLVEVLVAFAILAFTLATAYGVFSDSVRAVASGERHGVALALAESRLAEIDAMPADEPWDSEGDFNDTFHWRVETRPLPDSSAGGDAALEPVLVSVTVTWDRGAPVTLDTIRLRRR